MQFYIHSHQESHRQAAEAIDPAFKQPRTVNLEAEEAVSMFGLIYDCLQLAIN
jgi:hypothetical protein